MTLRATCSRLDCDFKRLDLEVGWHGANQLGSNWKDQKYLTDQLEWVQDGQQSLKAFVSVRVPV
jgi:hypothetical protein